jgi:hypothetical protein
VEESEAFVEYDEIPQETLDHAEDVYYNPPPKTFYPPHPTVQEQEIGINWKRKPQPLPSLAAVELRSVSRALNDEQPRSSQTQALHLYEQLLQVNKVEDEYTLSSPEQYFTSLITTTYETVRYQPFTRKNANGEPNGMPLFFTELRQRINEFVGSVEAYRKDALYWRLVAVRSRRDHQRTKVTRLEEQPQAQRCVDGQVVSAYSRSNSGDEPPCSGVRFSLREMYEWEEVETFYYNLSAEELVALSQHYGAELTDEQIAEICAGEADGDFLCTLGDHIYICIHNDMNDMLAEAHNA